MVLRRLRTTAREAGLVLSVLAAGSCTDWDDDCYVYDCAPVYYPYFGYYSDCYAVRTSCGHDGDHHRHHGRACKLDGDCEPAQYCSSDGYCSANAADAGADGGASGGSGYPANWLDASVSLDASSTGISSGGGGSNGGGGNGASNGGSSSGSGGSGAGPDAGAQVGSSGGAGGTASGGADDQGTSGGRIRRFNFPCQRDTQCGAGKCDNGDCYDACDTDSQCGTADRCSVETGRRICMPDPNPVVKCQDSSECKAGQSCLDGSCHDPCDVDTDCANPEDRCLHNLCVPDRRPMVECVLNVECSTGLMCLDGRCVDLDGL